MANPEHVPTLDALDRLTVRLYRGGLLLASASLLGLAAVYAARVNATPAPSGIGDVLIVLIGAAAALSAANLHLYDKRVRWLLAGAAPLGLAIQALALTAPAGFVLNWPLQTAGLGFGFVTLSGLALKERFCFRIPGLRGAPVLLAGALVPLTIDWPIGVPLLLAPASVLLGWLAVAKLWQPLHFDVGDKSAYQV